MYISLLKSQTKTFSIVLKTNKETEKDFLKSLKSQFNSEDEGISLLTYVQLSNEGLILDINLNDFERVGNSLLYINKTAKKIYASK